MSRIYMLKCTRPLIVKIVLTLSDVKMSYDVPIVMTEKSIRAEKIMLWRSKK